MPLPSKRHFSLGKRPPFSNSWHFYVTAVNCANRITYVDPSLIFLNYFVDPKRRSRHYRDLLANLDPTKYVFTDTLSAGDEPRVRIIVNKTRELSANTLATFPHLAGICLNTTDQWMLTFDDNNSPITIQTVDTDRGTDVAEVAVLLMLTGLKTLADGARWHAFRSPTRFYRQLVAPTAGETVGAHNWTGTSTLTAYRKKGWHHRLRVNRTSNPPAHQGIRYRCFLQSSAAFFSNDRTTTRNTISGTQTIV